MRVGLQSDPRFGRRSRAARAALIDERLAAIALLGGASAATSRQEWRPHGDSNPGYRRESAQGYSSVNRRILPNIL